MTKILIATAALAAAPLCFAATVDPLAGTDGRQTFGDSMTVDAAGVGVTFAAEYLDGAKKGKGLITAAKTMGLGVHGNGGAALNNNEALVVSFDGPVLLGKITLGNVSKKDHAVLTITTPDGETVTRIGGDGAADGFKAPKGVEIGKKMDVVTFDPPTGLRLPEGSTIRLTNESSTNNNYYLASLDVTPAQ